VARRSVCGLPAETQWREREDMGIGDKAKHAGENVAGKAKEVGGEARGDKPLKNKGKRDQAKSQLKQGAENVKDAVKKTK
jgi:uncharacterized protein YjbJ (UPF0337 family)